MGHLRGRLALKFRGGAVKADCEFVVVPVAQRMMNTPAAVGEKRQADRDGAIQYPLDGRAEPAVAAPGENDDLLAAPNFRTDRLEMVFYYALAGRFEPASKAALAKCRLMVGVNNSISACFRQEAGKQGWRQVVNQDDFCAIH